MSFASRAARARVLAERHPEARAALEFYAAVAEFQERADPDDFVGLRALVLRVGPEALRESARELDAEAVRAAVSDYLSGRDRVSTRSFFARTLLQMRGASERAKEGNGQGCPRCGHPPQVGVLREEGHGTALSLLCSICFAEWPSPRGRCPSCGEGAGAKLAVFQAPQMEHAQVRACESCRRYLLVVRRDLDPESLPEVDEIAALALDVWAREAGFVKIQPNLAGI